MAQPAALIIDDDEGLQDLFAMGLGDMGYETHAVKNAALARKWLEARAPDLIVLDVMMPDGNGLDLCRWIRADPRLAAVPILISSALQDQETESDALEFGAMDFLRKPFTLENLREKVERIRRR